MADEYLLEIRSREMPLVFVRKTVRQLATRFFEDLMGRGLGPREVTTGATPRRLVLVLSGLPDREPDREEREIGPPVVEAYDGGGEPTEALLGFAGRVGRAIDELETVKTERGEYLAATRTVAGGPLPEVLSETVPRLLAEVTWGRRTGTGDPSWVRPLSGFLSVLDGELVPFAYGGLEAGLETCGHPRLSPAAFEVTGWDDYRERLRALAIETSPEVRRKLLYDAFIERAVHLGGELVEDDELLERLAWSCEIPGVVVGAFGAEELGLPEEILLATLGQLENAFAVRRKGSLLATFLTMMDRPDDPEGRVRRGQERATAGRLSDARFYYEKDRSIALAERSRNLDQLSFHPQLGSLADKTERVRALAELICGELGWDGALEPALEAATLLKADLSTEMVREFADLRGTTGGIYAREEGYVEAVWQAIYDQYRPASRSGPIPRHRVGQVVAVADRLDTLVGFLGIGPVPSASKDPYALRRLTQGLLRILIEAEVELDLDLVAARAVLLFGEHLELAAQEVLERLQTLLADRVTHVLGQRGFVQDEVEAAMAVGMKNLPMLAARVAALHKVRRSPEFASLVLAARRIANIVKESPEFELAEELLVEDAEIELSRTVGAVRDRAEEAIAERRFEDCLEAMLELVPALDRFFADVLVMDEDEGRRHNRIALLQSCRRVFWRIARLKEMAVAEDPHSR